MLIVPGTSDMHKVPGNSFGHIANGSIAMAIVPGTSNMLIVPQSIVIHTRPWK